MTSLRLMVLKNFRNLHRTRIRVFEGDLKALAACRLKINEEFRKNKHVTDEESIKAMLKFGDEVELQLRTQVIQACEVKPGVFEARLTSDTLKLDNIPYNDAAIPDEEGVNGNKSCCQKVPPTTC